MVQRGQAGKTTADDDQHDNHHNGNAFLGPEKGEPLRGAG